MVPSVLTTVVLIAEPWCARAASGAKGAGNTDGLAESPLLAA